MSDTVEVRANEVGELAIREIVKLPVRGIAELPVREIAARVSARTLTAQAVTQAFLERIAEREGELGAWEYLDADQVQDAARAIDAIPGALALKGVPVGVKDIMNTADMPTGYGRDLAAAARASLPDVFAEVDAWLAPAAPGPAPVGLTSTGDPLFNRLWTVLHCPCLALPCISAGGLPVGVQLITAADDATALRAAAFLELALREMQHAE